MQRRNGWRFSANSPICQIKTLAKFSHCTVHLHFTLYICSVHCNAVRVILLCRCGNVFTGFAGSSSVVSTLELCDFCGASLISVSLTEVRFCSIVRAHSYTRAFPVFFQHCTYGTTIRKACLVDSVMMICGRHYFGMWCP